MEVFRMTKPLAYKPEYGFQYQILTRPPGEKAYEHCDYAKDKTEKDHLLNEYRLAYGTGFFFKAIPLPRKYWKAYWYKILGFYVHNDDKEVNALTAMIIIDSNEEKLTCYTPKEQHAEITWEYLKECRAISKEQYIEAARNFHTPAEYLK